MQDRRQSPSGARAVRGPIAVHEDTGLEPSSLNPFLWLLGAAITVLQLGAALHALLYKRDPRATFGWVVVCLLFPIAGPLLYFLFGINRIHTRARELGLQPPHPPGPGGHGRRAIAHADPEGTLGPGFENIVRVSDALTDRPLLPGNRLEPLFNGEEAYPAMLRAIDGAERRVYLATYIFQADESGRQFIEALGRATDRGVDVRVIVDGVGALYSLPRTGVRLLQRRGVDVVRFLPPTLIPPSFYVNLRTHRKLLVSDGAVSFTGGINIGDRYLAFSPEPPSRATDIHFRVEGPVVRQMEQAFLEDWHFCRGKTGHRPPPPLEPVDDSLARFSAWCRAVSDGPDEELDKLTTILVAAINAARSRVSIMTPYFLPSREMVSALQTAALRGVEVTVILPGRNNLPYVHWACQNMLWEVVRHDVRVYYQPPPFAHTKLFLVDDYFSVIGSANLDPRSLRLNFELVTEVFDRDFNARMHRHVQEIRAVSQAVSLDHLDRRSLAVRTRDSLAWLFSPYL